MRRVIRRQGVARVLDGCAAVAAEHGGALLIASELDHPGRRVLLQRGDHKIRRSLAGLGIEDDVPFVVEEVAAEGQQERVPGRHDRIARQAVEHDRIFDLAARDPGLAFLDHLIPGLRRAIGVDVVAVGERLNVADKRHADQLWSGALEPFDPGSGLRRPVAHVDHGLDPILVGAVDPSGAEIFQDLGGAELRDPRIVKQVEVVLPSSALRVVEKFLERDAVFVLQELDVESLLLGQRNDLVLEGHEGAVDKAADHDFLVSGARRSRRA